ncbi:MAG: hypothetical protein HDT21_03210 [Ruminococcus sp.]|nr:hypothetical protein [Ruminococcus sp.]
MEIAKFIRDAAKYIQDGLSSKESSEPIKTAQPAKMKEVAGTASKPPKPSRECINDFGVDGRFMLCGDFVESKSHAGEVEILYVYAPDCDDDYIGYSGKEPYFMISSGIDEVYCNVTNFLESGTVDGVLKFEKRNAGSSLFYAEMDYYGDRLAMYAFARDTVYGNEVEKEPFGLCVVYGSDLVGTELEKRFLNALKEAAETYRETVNAE